VEAKYKINNAEINDRDYFTKFSQKDKIVVFKQNKLHLRRKRNFLKEHY